MVAVAGAEITYRKLPDVSTVRGGNLSSRKDQDSCALYLGPNIGTSAEPYRLTLHPKPQTGPRSLASLGVSLYKPPFGVNWGEVARICTKVLNSPIMLAMSDSMYGPLIVSISDEGGLGVGTVRNRYLEDESPKPGNKGQQSLCSTYLRASSGKPNHTRNLYRPI